MTSKTLLPTGCYDLLPPDAKRESELSARLLATFEAYGYEQVSPSILEYSDDLLAGRGAALAKQIFRVMDPEAHRMMGIRADITPQIARIATTRLADQPLPLRLSYNGLVLRMQGERLGGNRQLRQTGIELIGSDSADADAEIIIVAARALQAAGITELVIDLNIPGIVGALLETQQLDGKTQQSLTHALAHKDVAAIKALPIIFKDNLVALVESAGPVAQALPKLERLDLPANAKNLLADLKQVAERIAAQNEPKWRVTIDATESRNITYQSGLSFSMFVPGSAREAGRGGRYTIERNGKNLPATGFTLYVEGLRELMPQVKKRIRKTITADTDAANIAELQAEGFITVFALSEGGL